MAITTRTSRSRLAGGAPRALALTLALFVVSSLVGCVKPLFPKDGVRTQYETYDLVRNQHEPDFIYDEYGRRTPNLRGRLNPNRR